MFNLIAWSAGAHSADEGIRNVSDVFFLDTTSPMNMSRTGAATLKLSVNPSIDVPCRCICFDQPRSGITIRPKTTPTSAPFSKPLRANLAGGRGQTTSEMGPSDYGT
jgi:hypothetical protein